MIEENTLTQCGYCSQEFISINGKLYCSAECKKQKQKQFNLVDYECDFCKKPIKIKTYNKREGRNNFCSRSCTAKYGAKISSEKAKAIRDAKTPKEKKPRTFSEERKREYSEKFKGANNPRFGVKLDDDLRKKISEAIKEQFEKTKDNRLIYEFECKNCKVKFTSYMSFAKFCTPYCAQVSRNRSMGVLPRSTYNELYMKEKYNKKCLACDKGFVTKNENAIFCSRQCHIEHRRSESTRYVTEERSCVICGKQFTTYINEKKRFCTTSCRNVHNNAICDKIKKGQKISKILREGHESGKYVSPWIGRHHTEETKQLISKHHKESGCFVGEKNYMYCKTHTKEAREKISDAVSKDLGYKPWLHNKTGKFYSNKNNTEYIFRSSWEEVAFNHLEQDDDVFSYKAEPFRIEYEYKFARHYTPDILIEYRDGKKLLVEIKPKLLTNYEINVEKFKAAERYCQKNNMLFEVWTESKINSIRL